MHPSSFSCISSFRYIFFAIIQLQSIPRFLLVFFFLAWKTVDGFSFRAYDWVGFDLDFTLVEYKIQEVEELAFRIALKHLIDEYEGPSGNCYSTTPSFANI